MRTQYIADDGTSFDTKEKCQQYENENVLSNYDKEWGEHITLKERAHAEESEGFLYYGFR